MVSDSNADDTWPEEASERAKLIIPTQYDPYQDVENPRLCVLKYDAARKVLMLVAEDTKETMDYIDPSDVIGASLEVGLSSDSTAPRVTTNDAEDSVNEPTSSVLTDTQASACLTIYAYPKVDPSKQPIGASCTKVYNTKPVTEFPSSDASELGHRYAHHRKFQVVPAEDMADISAVVTAIKNLARPNSKKQRLLVLVNPFAGRKTSVEIYENYVDPMLAQAGVNHDQIHTTHAGHCEEIMAKRGSDDADGISDISEYDGLIAIGGDGIVAELMQGINRRSDCDKILKKLKLGHIGAGTSNGLSASLAHASQECFTPTDYTFMVAKGKTTRMDLSKYETTSNNYLSFLTLSWGIIADIDIESEVLRFLGFMRMDVYGVWRVLNLRTYRARLSYLPPSDSNEEVELPPLSDPIPTDGNWKTIEDDFVLFWASQVTHAGETMPTHPQCRPDDGLFHIFFVRRKNVSMFKMALVLLALDSGGHVDMDCSEYIDCTAYRLEPLSPGSYNDLDGEVIEAGPVQGKVLQGAIEAFATL